MRSEVGQARGRGPVTRGDIPLGAGTWADDDANSYANTTVPIQRTFNLIHPAFSGSLTFGSGATLTAGSHPPALSRNTIL